MKKKLEELIARKQKFIKEAREKVKNSSSVDEVRSLGDQIEEAQRDIDEARAMLAEAEEQRADDAQGKEETDEQGGEDARRELILHGSPPPIWDFPAARRPRCVRR